MAKTSRAAKSALPAAASGPLTFAQRQASGVAAREAAPRNSLGRFDPEACPADPISLLFAAERGRLPDLLAIKHKLMAKSAFSFFRGAASIMAADLAAHPSSGLLTQLCGDAHLANLGAFADPTGRLVFDINDFDETIRGPFEFDLKRFATSILLGGRQAGIARRLRRSAVLRFIESYQRSMALYAAMPIHELACHRVHLAHRRPITGIFRLARHATPQESVDKLITRTKGGRRIFRTDLPKLRPLNDAEAAPLLRALDVYAATLEPGHRHFLAQYKPTAFAFKMVGTGSIGLRCYCVYLEGTHAATADPLFLQVKEEAPSAYSPFLPSGDTHTNQGQRVVDGQRSLQLTSDPFLGYTRMPDGQGKSRDYLVRQLNDHKASLDPATLTSASLRGYAGIAGEIFARGHARAGDPVALSAYLGRSSTFAEAILDFARSYADKTEHDCRLLQGTLSR